MLLSLIGKFIFYSVPPIREPRILGMATTYKIGDTVKVTCQSMDSKPAPNMQWLINKQNVSTTWHIYIHLYKIKLCLIYSYNAIQNKTINISGYVEYGLANQNNHESEDNA